MSLFKRGNVWWSRVMIHGEVYVQSLRTRNKNEAKNFEALWRSEHLRGEHGLATAPTLTMFGTKFLNHCLEPGRLKPSTKRAYIARFDKLAKYAPLANAKLDKIDADLIAAFRAQHPQAQASTMNAWLRTLKTVLRYAVERGVIRTVPVKITISDLSENRREYTLSEPVLQQFLDRAPTPVHRALWAVLADTGLRISEACALTWEDVEGNPPVAVQVRKGKSKYARRRIPLTKRAAAALASLPRSVFVFSRPRPSGKHGHQINQTWAGHPFLAIRRELGLPEDCVLHSLRHTFLTRLGNSGASPFVIQKLAGHSDISMSARYSHPDDAQMDKAVEGLN